MQSNLRKDYFWNTIGVFLQNAISPLLLIVITRFNGIEDSGLFSFAFSISILFWAIGMWGGRTYQVSDTKQEYAHTNYIVMRIVLVICMVIGSVLFCLINNYDVTKSILIVVLVVFKAFESVADAYYGVLQVHGKLYQGGKSLFYKAVLGTAVFIIVDVFTRSIVLASLGLILVNAVVFLLYDVQKAREVENLDITYAKVKKNIYMAFLMIRRTATVFAITFLAMFSLNIPRYFVDIFRPEEIGYFGIIAMPITLIVLLMSFILQPNAVRLSNLYENKVMDKFRIIVRDVIGVTFLVGIIILIATYFLGVPLLQLVFGVDFGEYKEELIVIVAGGTINAIVSIFINILIIMRKLKSQLLILIGTNLLLVIFCIVLVESQGLIGAVSLFSLTSLMQLILLGVLYNVTTRKSVYA